MADNKTIKDTPHKVNEQQLEPYYEKDIPNGYKKYTLPCKDIILNDDEKLTSTGTYTKSHTNFTYKEIALYIKGTKIQVQLREPSRIQPSKAHIVTKWTSWGIRADTFDFDLIKNILEAFDIEYTPQEVEITYKTCPRCGGTGQYSWNATHGSTCYGCSGHGVVSNLPNKEVA